MILLICKKNRFSNMSLVMRKPAFCICENKDADQLRGYAKLISIFILATRIVQSLYFLNPKFQASSHLLWLYSPVCVGPGRNPRKLVFQQRGSYSLSLYLNRQFLTLTWTKNRDRGVDTHISRVNIKTCLTHANNKDTN